MANVVEIKVPDIGDFKDVPIIELFVKPGDTVAKEQALITLESDKATMEVPSPQAGVVKDVKVKAGGQGVRGQLDPHRRIRRCRDRRATEEKVKEGASPKAEGAPTADYGAPTGVLEAVDVNVPDIGDFKDVPIIEVFVKAGDTVTKEQALITLESDKATMEVPSPMAGTVKEVKVKVGDKVSEGTVILSLTTGVATSATAAAPAAGAPAAPVAAPTAAKFAGGADIECEMVVLGAGPGGYSAAFRAADLGMKTVLIERYPTLGGVCLNVGCIPSKALLHTAAVMDEAVAMAHHGITYGAPQIDIDKLRGFKEGVVKKLTGGLAGMAKGRKVETVRGVGRFLDPNNIEVELTTGSGHDKTGEKKVVRFQKAIIAAGSQAVMLPFMPVDPRVVDSTGALELKSIPKRMLVVGGGIIGLEMATVYSTLGTSIDVVEMLDALMTGADRDLVKVWEKKNARSLRQRHAEDQDHRRRGDAGRHQGDVRRRRRRRRSRRCTTSCWSRWGAARTGRRSVPRMPGWR